MKTTAVQRQNDPKAITLLKASERCLRNERISKYFMIVLSVGICLAAIFNRYLPQIFGDTSKVADIQQTAAMYINLISGGIIVAGIPLGFYSTRMHTEGTVLRDRYEAYVFDNPTNLSILRPISETFVSMYAKKLKKPDEKFKNYLYPEKAEEGSAAQFDYISETAHSDYQLYLYVQPFFVVLWVGFCLLIVLIAVSLNDMFVTTLINIMIPSLSIITTIGTSWYNCRLQMRQLTNLLNVIDRIQSMPIEKRRIYIAKKENIRLLADGLFNYRSSAFVIPNFLVRKHNRSLMKDQRFSGTAEPTEPLRLEAPAEEPQTKAASATPVKEATAPAKPPLRRQEIATATASEKPPKPAIKPAVKAKTAPAKPKTTSSPSSGRKSATPNTGKSKK